MGEQRSQETSGTAGGGNSQVRLFHSKTLKEMGLLVIYWFLVCFLTVSSQCAFSLRSRARFPVPRWWHFICTLHILFCCPKDLIQFSFFLCNRHTLWRHLQSTVTPLLASMVEVMDRFANLDLLTDRSLSQGLLNLWLDILDDPQILDPTPLQKSR